MKFFGRLARTTALLSLLVAFLATANYLLQNTPDAAARRNAKENAANVFAAGRIYAAAGWPGMNPDPDPADLPELQPCDCDSIASAFDPPMP